MADPPLFAPENHLDDPFAGEQAALDTALTKLSAIWNGNPCTAEEYAFLVMDYSRLLQRARSESGLMESLSRKILDLHEAACLDALTGIHNRRYLEDNLRRIVRALRRSGGELGILMVDVDFFKQYNDVHGHTRGDEVLRRVAAALDRALARAEDFAVRYGGDEFTVVLPQTGEAGTRRVAEKVLKTVKACTLEYISCSIPLGVSIGATAGKVTPARSGEHFMRLADQALYRAKAGGRGRYNFMSFEEE